MKILSANEQTVTGSNGVTERLAVTAREMTADEIVFGNFQTVECNEISYVGYIKLKSYRYDKDSDTYEIILEKPPELEQKVQQIAGIVLIEPEKMSLPECKVWAAEKTKTLIDEKLRHGIPFNGKIYNASKEKQDLLSNQLGLYMINAQAGISDTLTWNTKDGVCEEYSFDELLGLANAMKSYAQPLVKKQQEAEIEIKAAVSREEIEAILAEFA